MTGPDSTLSNRSKKTGAATPLVVNPEAAQPDEQVAATEVGHLLGHVDAQKARSLCAGGSDIVLHGEFDIDSLSKVRAVGFDLYDTVLLSTGMEHGIINAESDPMHIGVARALDRCDALSAELRNKSTNSPFVSKLVEQFRGEERAQKIVELRSGDQVFYEMDAPQIWQKIFSLSNRADAVRFATQVELTRSRYGLIPEARDFIQGLRSKGIEVFLISNSQSYTPAILEGVLLQTGLSPDNLFDPALCLYSHRVLLDGRGVMKPTLSLFDTAFDLVAARVEERDSKRWSLQRDEVLFIGNCLRNDGAARKAGFQFGLIDCHTQKTRREEGAQRDGAYFEFGSYAALAAHLAPASKTTRPPLA
jgi:FMN phosphatase YigB (HAD superfamily)